MPARKTVVKKEVAEEDGQQQKAVVKKEKEQHQQEVKKENEKALKVKKPIVKQEAVEATTEDDTSAPEKKRKRKKKNGQVIGIPPAHLTKLRLEEYKNFVYDRAKAMCPKLVLSPKAACVLSELVDVALEKILSRTLDIFSLQKKEAITASHVHIALRTLLDDQLYKAAIKTATEAIADRKNNDEKLLELYSALEKQKKEQQQHQEVAV